MYGKVMPWYQSMLQMSSKRCCGKGRENGEFAQLLFSGKLVHY